MNLLTSDHPSSLDRFPPPLLRCRLSDILYRSPRRRLSESLIATDTAIAAFYQAMASLRLFRTCDMTVSYVKRGLILLIASEAVRLAHTTMAAGTQVFPQVMMRGAILFLCNSHDDDATMQCVVFARHSPFDTYSYATENIN